MNIYKFGEALLETQDLDPVYVGVAKADLATRQLSRWLMAYWMFYHVGAASWLSEQEGEKYWEWVALAAENNTSPPRGGRWPRAAERRHFRGVACMNAVAKLRQFDPVYLVGRLSDLRTQAELMEAVQTWPLFGPWIAFKAADMMERVYGSRVSFEDNIGLVYKEPRAALDILTESTSEERAQAKWLELRDYFGGHRAPPGHDRHCGPQEVETILCKWKSHIRGHYRVGKDIHEVRLALHGWGETAERVLSQMPEEVGYARYHD